MVFKHSGFPYTLYSSNVGGVLSGYNYYSTVFANVIAPTNMSCGNSAALLNNPCYNINDFADPTVIYGNQRRNQFRGPGFFDTDFAVEKGLPLPKWEGASFSVGARMFNLFNHPNFNNPVTNIDNPQFGSILSTANTPTSIFGSGLGASASPRLIQLQAKLTF